MASHTSWTRRPRESWVDVERPPEAARPVVQDHRNPRRPEARRGPRAAVRPRHHVQVAVAYTEPGVDRLAKRFCDRPTDASRLQEQGEHAPGAGSSPPAPPHTDDAPSISITKLVLFKRPSTTEASSPPRVHRASKATSPAPQSTPQTSPRPVDAHANAAKKDTTRAFTSTLMFLGRIHARLESPLESHSKMISQLKPTLQWRRVRFTTAPVRCAAPSVIHVTSSSRAVYSAPATWPGPHWASSGSSRSAVGAAGSGSAGGSSTSCWGGGGGR